MLKSAGIPLAFAVRRGKPELVAPCKPTPREMKHLSDIDEQEFLRCQMPILLFYRARRTSDGSEENIGRVIREALGKALVHYYPWAGRLREVHGPKGKLAVDCSGEGVLFVEAEADVTLEELRGEEGFLRPPFPCVDDLLFDVPGSSDILHSPLLLFQVTRLRCGGFVLALRMNHTMSDGTGIVEFLNAIAEIARGASQPSVMPVWRREILCSQGLPHVTSTHQSEPEESKLTVFPVDPNDDEHNNGDRVIHRTFFFGPNELSIIRQRLHPRLRSCTTFELLAAFLWRCRIIALRLHSLEDVSFNVVVNVRPRFNLPAGYYGNAIVLPAAVSQAGKIITSLEHAVELLKRAKAEVTLDFVRSVSVRPGPIPTHFQCTAATGWVISDIKYFKFLDIDFGWGKPVYGGPVADMMDEHVGPVSFFISGMNGKGQSGVLVPACLPPAAMDRFAKLLHFNPTPKI